MRRVHLIENLLEQAWDLRSDGNYDESRATLEKAHNLCYEQDFLYLGRIFHIKMQYEADHDRFVQAIVFCQKSLSFHLKLGHKDKIAHSTRHLAELLMQVGKIDEAEQQFFTALQIYRDNPDTNMGDLANALRGFALLLEQKKDYLKAVETWKEVSQLYQKIGIRSGVIEAENKIIQLQ